MSLLVQVTSDVYESTICQLFLEYVQLLNEAISREYGVSIDVEAIHQMFMSGTDKFYPPRGRLYLCKHDNEYVGIGCLKELDNDIGEIKRMFVRSKHRGKGFGKMILDQLIADARSIGYNRIYLDSPKVFPISHNLYQSRGFAYIELFPGSEGAASKADIFVYMELVL